MLRSKTFLLIAAVIGMTVSLPTDAQGQKFRGQLADPFLDNPCGHTGLSDRHSTMSATAAGPGTQ